MDGTKKAVGKRRKDQATDGPVKRPRAQNGTPTASAKRADKKPTAVSGRADKKPTAVSGRADKKPTSAEPKAKAAGGGVPRQKENLQLIQQAVKQWEVARVKSVSKEEKQALAHEVAQQMKGKVMQLANQHTASRIIQFCAKWCTAQDRAAVLAEVRSNLLDLAKSKYGHFLVRKLVNTAQPKEVEDLAKVLKGHAGELLRHPYGADVVMDLYDVLSSEARNSLVAEFYGNEFRLFDGVTAQGAKLQSLAQVMGSAPAAKRRAILLHFTRQLNPIMEKSLLHPPVVHRLVKDFLEAAPASAVADAVDTMSATGGGVLKMAHTHEGASAGCMVLAYGTPKDRKRVLKGMKGFVMKLALDEWGHTLLLTALSVVDDTSLLQKTIVQECQAAMEELLESKFGRRVVLQLLAPDCPRHLPPHILQMIHPPERTVKATAKDKDAAPEEEADAAPAPAEGATTVLGVSRKEPTVRRTELLGQGGKSLAVALCRHCSAHAAAMLREAGACDLVVEVCRGGSDGLLQQLCPSGVGDVQRALAEEAAQPQAAQGKAAEEAAAEEGPSTSGSQHVLVDYFGSRSIRRLVLQSAGDEGGAGVAAEAVRQLWEAALKGRCAQWAGTHADKVLAALLSCGQKEVAAGARKELKKCVKKDLEAWAQQLVPTKGGA